MCSSHRLHTGLRPILSFVQLHGTGTQQLHVRVEELREVVMEDELMETLSPDG